MENRATYAGAPFLSTLRPIKVFGLIILCPQIARPADAMRTSGGIVNRNFMVLGAAILAVTSAVYAQDDAKPHKEKVRRLGPQRRRHRPRQRRLRQEVHRLPLRRQRLQENRPRPQRHRQARHLHRKQQQSHRRIPQNLDRKRRHHDAPLQRSPRTRPNQRRRRLRQIPLIPS